jgi:hypothetical protein
VIGCLGVPRLEVNSTGWRPRNKVAGYQNGAARYDDSQPKCPLLSASLKLNGLKQGEDKRFEISQTK